MHNSEPLIAIVIPCLNESAAIGSVVDEARNALPHAKIFVFDNRSTDTTATVAREHGATVIHVAARGKGHVVRRMFADVEADIYLMVDGDATYDLSNAADLVSALRVERLDMVVGSRAHDALDHQAYRSGHQFGNKLLTKVIRLLFGGATSDLLSGYRVFSRRFVKSFPALSNGFEIETELTVHALELRMPNKELSVHYQSRPKGGQSKLNTYSDGLRILLTIVKLFVTERPFTFFSVLSALLAIVSLGLTIPLFVTYLETGLVPRLPTAVLATGAMLCAALSIVCGAILNTVTIGRLEAKRLRYLSIPATHHMDRGT